MSSESPERLERQRRLAALQQAFAADLPRRVEELAVACERAARDREDASLREACYRLAHDLAGASGTFGLPEAGRLAWLLAEACRDKVWDGIRIAGLLARLESSARRSLPGGTLTS